VHQFINWRSFKVCEPQILLILLEISPEHLQIRMAIKLASEYTSQPDRSILIAKARLKLCREGGAISLNLERLDTIALKPS
jgi:hypothetical protein